MSRKGDCWDKAVSESFFATLRAERVDDERYLTVAAVEKSIGDYVARFYDVERLHSHLDYLSPVDFELSEDQSDCGIVRLSAETGEDRQRRSKHARGPTTTMPLA